MFYIKHCYEEEEASFLRSWFGLSLPPSQLPDLNFDSLLRLRGIRTGTLSGSKQAELWLDADTASWAVLEGKETAIASDLCQGVSHTSLLLHLGREREEALRRLLGHLWQSGLLEVDGKSRWPRDIFTHGPLFRPSYLVEIQLTSRCNLACRYCFAQSGPLGKDLQEELAHKSVNLALALPTKDLTIEFSGGEPLLRFPLLQKLIMRIERASSDRSNPVCIAVQTNGLLLKGEILKFFAQHRGVEVGISLDGPRFVNDVARVTSRSMGRHAAIEAAARAAVSVWGKQAGALAVVHAKSGSHPREIAEYFASLGLGKMRFNPMVGLGRGKAEGASLAISPAQYLYFMQEMLDFLRETRAFEESNLEALVRNLILKTRDYRCMRSPCGAGYDYLVVTPTADLYPCARFIHHPDLLLGNIADGKGLRDRFIDNRLVCDMANRTVLHVPNCQGCLFRHFCGGGCSLEAYTAFGSLREVDPFCKYYREIYPYLIEYLYQYPEMLEHFFPGAVAWHVSTPDAGI